MYTVYVARDAEKLTHFSCKHRTEGGDSDAYCKRKPIGTENRPFRRSTDLSKLSSTAVLATQGTMLSRSFTTLPCLTGPLCVACRRTAAALNNVDRSLWRDSRSYGSWAGVPRIRRQAIFSADCGFRHSAGQEIEHQFRRVRAQSHVTGIIARTMLMSPQMAVVVTTAASDYVASFTHGRTTTSSSIVRKRRTQQVARCVASAMVLPFRYRAVCITCMDRSRPWMRRRCTWIGWRT